jgi:hypothetical protein
MTQVFLVETAGAIDSPPTFVGAFSSQQAADDCAASRNAGIADRDEDWCSVYPVDVQDTAPSVRVVYELTHVRPAGRTEPPLGFDVYAPARDPEPHRFVREQGDRDYDDVTGPCQAEVLDGPLVGFVVRGLDKDAVVREYLARTGRQQD